MKIVVNVFLMIFLTRHSFYVKAQSEVSYCKAEPIQQFSLEKEEYHFSFTNTSQALNFSNIIYSNYPKIRVKIFNETQDTLISLYRERDAHIYWLRSGKFDTIYPGQAMTLTGLASSGKFMGSLNGSSINFQYRIKDKVYSNKIWVYGSMYPIDSRKSSSLATQIDSNDDSIKPLKKEIITKEIITTDTIIKVRIENMIYSDTLPLPIPREYDSIPFMKDKISISGFFRTTYGETRATWVSRNVFIDGSVLEYYSDGQLYSKRTKIDSSDVKPYFTSYYQDGKLWMEESIKQSIEYAENGKIKVITKDDVKTTYFFNGNGKIGSIEYLGNNRNISSPIRTEFHYKTGCKTKEIYKTNYITDEGQTEIKYREDICDCPISKINGVREIYYKKCDLSVGKIRELKFSSLKTGEFDSLLNLLTGKDEIGRYMGKFRTYTFTKLNNNYLPAFKFRRSAEISNLQFRDSIFVVEFNTLQNGKKEGTWLECNLSTEELVSKLYVWKHKEYRYTNEFVLQYPLKIYKQGELKETHYYSDDGDLTKRIQYQGLDSIVTNYEYKLLLDSNTVVNIDSTYAIISNDTISYYYQNCCHTVLVYENSELKQKSSPRYKAQLIVSDDWGSRIDSNSLPFTIEKGEFKALDLYNGTVEYYDKNAKLIKVVTMINGTLNPENR